MTWYHGTNATFNKFEMQEMDMAHADQGIGLYFTDNIEMARKYGDHVYEVEITSKKQVSSTDVTLSESDVEFIIKYLEDSGEDFLENYGYVPDEGYENVMRMAVEGTMATSNDVTLLVGFTGAGVSAIPILEALVKLGYTDGLVVDNGNNILVVYDPDAVTIVREL